MRLRAIEQGDLPLTLQWRNDPAARVGLRTPFPLNLDQQEQFYRDVICNRQSAHRYWMLEDVAPVGMVGLTNISWENRIGEISLITDPGLRGKGYGSAGCRLVLQEAFGVLGLLTVCGECYVENPALGFWQTMVTRYDGSDTILPRRKFWHGRLCDGYYFTFAAEQTMPLLDMAA